MDTKRLAIGTVVGGIAMFAVGYLIWNIALDYWVAGFDAAGVTRESALLWAVALSNVPHAALVTLAIGWSGSSTIGGKKSRLCTRAMSSFSLYTAESSEVLDPTRRLGSLIGGSWLRTWTRSSGLNLEAQPAQWARLVSFMFSLVTMNPRLVCYVCP